MDTLPRSISIHPNPNVKPDGKFYLQAKHLALTYPRCSQSRESCLTYLKDRLPPIKRYLIAQENHDDPENAPTDTRLHLHVYLEMEEKHRTRDCRFADFLQYHGKYESVKILKDWVTYCTKEDLTPLANWDFKSFLAGKPAKPNKRAILGEQLINNRLSLEELIPTNPELIFGYKKLKLDINEYLNDIAFPTIRSIKAYWYYGPTRLGKSWKALVDTGVCTVVPGANGQFDLSGDLKTIYFKNSQNKWFDGYADQKIVFIDELPIEANKWNANYIKQWTDRIPHQCEIKNAKVWARWERVYVTCQHSIREYYADLPQPDVEAILARFQQIHITIKQY